MTRDIGSLSAQDLDAIERNVDAMKARELAATSERELAAMSARELDAMAARELDTSRDVATTGLQEGGAPRGVGARGTRDLAKLAGHAIALEARLIAMAAQELAMVAQELATDARELAMDSQKIVLAAREASDREVCS